MSVRERTESVSYLFKNFTVNSVRLEVNLHKTRENKMSVRGKTHFLVSRNLMKEFSESPFAALLKNKVPVQHVFLLTVDCR